MTSERVGKLLHRAAQVQFAPMFERGTEAAQLYYREQFYRDRQGLVELIADLATALSEIVGPLREVPDFNRVKRGMKL